MVTSVIELNDSEVRLGNNGSIKLRSPGYAFVNDDGIQIGEAAASQARLQPRAANNRFWKNLNQEKLQFNSAKARHNADLAFAHLLDIHHQSGKPEKVIFAVPASFNNEQLALLLGLVEASPMTAVGLVDSAIAACAGVLGPGNFQHLDIQLHQSVLTRIDVDENVRRESVQIIDNAGLANIFDLSAHLIADQFIKESRFDPQHHPETEQALYNQIPACMNSLLTHSEVALEVQYQQSLYQAKLPAELLHSKLAPLYETITGNIDGERDCIISHKLNRLPGFRSLLEHTEVLEENSVLHGCYLYETEICENESGLNFVTSLSASSEPLIIAKTEQLEDSDPTLLNNKQSITHILHEHHALPLGSNALYLSASGNISVSKSQESHCKIESVNGAIELTTLGDLTVFVNGSQVQQSLAVSAGDIVSFAGSKTEYVLIHVSG
ncbi:MAG: hypothetical protein GKR93_19220 [Gammaproteobacteria bacterium]|nr:hypothetical protein [Gammaproteobacteria bacterium]